MGGGDLNLKKSWHPTTLRNMERVWKAEQKHEAECKKIEELQKELAEERAREEIRQYAEDKGVVKKKADRLDWMYEGPASLLNREEYLLGKSVDKTFELLQQQEVSGGDFKTEDDTMPESVARKPTVVGNVTIDLANKIREDPLLVIKKQEEQNRKELLDNPVRMKQLQNMLRQMSESKKSKKKKKKTKSKKERRRKRSDSDASDSSQSGDEMYRRKGNDHNTRDGMRIPAYDRRRLDNSALNYVGGRKVAKRSRRRSSSPSTSPPKRYFREKDRNRYVKHPDSPKRAERQNREQPGKSCQLNAVEKERRLQEMISNAKWRDEQRDSNFKRHLDELKKESGMQEKTANIDFVTPMLNKAMNVGSVESRIKSNIYNIQRTKADLDKNFTKR